MKIYNTLTRQKEEFVPITAGEVKIYACGPTVYNYIHIGNARPICVFDVLRRYMEYRGLKVTYVQNFTDVDDKIIRKANEENSDYLTVSQRYIEEYKTDAEGLNVRPATIHPLATENIEEIINMVATLIDKGYAYASNNGDVYFRTNKDSSYGKRTQWISLFGKQRKKGNRVGFPLGEMGVRDGILSALQWQSTIWEKPLTSIAEARTSFSRTMRMRLHRVNAATALRLPIIGCIMATSMSTTAR